MRTAMEMITAAVTRAVEDALAQGVDPFLNIKTDDPNRVRIYTTASRNPLLNTNGGDYDYWTEVMISGNKIMIYNDWSAEFPRDMWLRCEDMLFTPVDISPAEYIAVVATAAKTLCQALIDAQAINRFNPR